MSGGVHKHHLIPIAEASSHPLIRILTGAQSIDGQGIPEFQGDPRFNVDSPDGSNWLRLSSSTAPKNLGGMARHIGSHPAYSELVRRILDDVKLEADDLIASGADSRAAYEAAADRVSKFQLWLKDGLVARAPGDGSASRPTLFLNAQDPMLPVGVTDQDGIRDLLNQISYSDIKQSKVFTDASYRDFLNSNEAKNTLFNVDARNEHGQRLDALSRAAYRDPEFHAALRQTQLGKLSLFDSFKGDESGRVGAFDALIYGVAAVALVKIAADRGQELEALLDELGILVTPELIQDLATGVFVGIAEYGVITLVTGGAGTVVKLSVEAYYAAEDIGDLITLLSIAFPEWDFIQGLEEVIQDFSGFLIKALNMFNQEFGIKQIVVADSESAEDPNVAVGGDDVELFWGRNNADIKGGGGDDFLVHTGYGSVDGGLGNDVIVSFFPDYIDENTRLEIDGGGGNDFIAVFGGAGPKVYGGSGQDTLFAWSFGAELYGGANEDHFIWSPNTLIGDAQAIDRLSLFGVINLTGGLAYGGEESEWAAQSFFPFIKYGINTDGELVVNFLGSEMYVANYTGGPNADENTLGIYVGALEFDFYRLIFDRPSIEATPLNEVLTAMFKTMGIVDADDPLMLDLDGDGLEFTGLGQSDTYFDLDGDGFAENTGWLRSDDGMLVLDRNGNGSIDDISELFGAPGVAGFTELNDLDSNSDGVIDGADARFAELQVWRDLDQDGVSDDGELFSLAELDIVSFDLNATAMNVQTSTDHSLRAQSSFTRGDGTQGDVFEVILNSSQFETRYLGDHGIAAWAKDLPDVKGYGLMTDLQLAAANDFALAELTENLVPNLTATNLADLVAAAQPILLAWNAANPGSRELAPVLIQTDANGTQRLDYGVYEEDAAGGYWRLASGAAVLDGNGVAIARPSLEDILDQAVAAGQSWQLQQIWSPERDAVLSDRPEAPYLVSVDAEGVVTILDHGVYLEDASGGYWQLASGTDILDGTGAVIARPGLEDVLAQTTATGESWRLEAFAAPEEAVQINDMAVFYDAAGSAVYDYAVFVSDGAGGGFWASAREVSAAAGAGLTGPAGPTHTDLQSFVDLYAAQLGATSAHAEVIDADRARYAAKTGGVDLGDLTTLVSGTDASGVLLYNHNIDQQTEFLGELIARFDYWEEAAAVRLAAQGGLSGFFQELVYDAEEDIFRATGEREMIPTFEAIFAAAPGTSQGALDYLEDWKPILDVVYVDFERHGAGEMSASFLFANVVAAYESQGLAAGLLAAADILGVPTEQVIADTTHGAVVNGDGEDNIFYVSGGDQVFKGGNGRDVYVIGKNFGSDVIEDIEAPFSNRGADSVRFADIKSTEVSARREGIDLILRVDATGDELRIVDQFEGRLPILGTGGDASNDTGVVEIIFADGVVWNMVEMALAVADPQATSDVLEGTAEIDVLDSGAGDDVMSGGRESDIYIYNVGYGNDQIEDNNDNILVQHYDMVKFGEGIEKESLTFHRDGGSDDLRITFDNPGDSLTLINQFHAVYTGVLGMDWADRVELFTFADGTSYSWSEIMIKILADAKTDGDDTIHGYFYKDRLDGGLGNDHLFGGDDADIYVFDRGYGQDVIYDEMTSIFFKDPDIVDFGAGIAQSDLLFTRAGADGDDLIIDVVGTTDRLTITDQFFAGNLSQDGTFAVDNRIEEFHFADGSSLTDAQVREILLGGTDGDDTLTGFFGVDTLDGGLGNDLLLGGDDGDSYVFDIGYGNDRILDAQTSIFFNDPDKVIFGAGVTTADVILSRLGDDLVFEFAGVNDSLTVEKQFAPGNLNNRFNEVELFSFADGTTWTAAQVEAMLLQGTDGDDTIVGFFGADTLDGGLGNDRLEGGDGGDTYIFNAGYGQDVIQDYQTSVFDNSPDAISFGAGLLASDIILNRVGANGRDLEVTFNGSTDRLLIENMLFTSFYEVEEFRFADGTTWTLDQIYGELLGATAGNDVILGTDNADVISGLGGDDTLTGKHGNDSLIGGVGNDRLHGSDGSDTYIFSRGDGVDVIEDNGFADTDRLVIHGYTPDEVTLGRSAPGSSHLVLTFAGTTDQITVRYALDNSAGDNIEEYIFDDGTVWVPDDLRAVLLSESQTSGDDLIHGFSTSDVLQGGLGNDQLHGQGGSDDYIFTRGDGVDVIEDNGYLSTDRLVIHGYTPDEVTVGRTSASSNHLLLTFAGTTDQITVRNTLNGSTLDTVEQIVFDDGTIWTPSDYRNAAMTGGDGNDTIYGFNTADTLDGGLGNDRLEGRFGGDTYIFDSGYGQDVIYDSGFNNDFDKVVFGAGIAANDLSLSYSSVNVNHLVVDVLSTGDRLTIEHMFGQTSRHIEAFEFADGTTWDRAAIIAETGAAAQAAMAPPLAGLQTLAGPAGTEEASGPGLSLSDLLESDGWREGVGIEAEILSLVDPDGGAGAVSSGASAPDGELAALAIFNTIQVMPELAAEDYGTTQ